MNIAQHHGSTALFQKQLSATREPLMGIAIILIMLFHLGSPALGYLRPLFGMYGYWGVDIFVFLSGFGIAHALQKTETASSLLPFYKKRLIRIMPACIISALLLLPIQHIPVRTVDTILRFSGLSLWYIRAILFFYLLSPFLWRIIKTNNSKSTFLLFTIVAASFLIIGIEISPSGKYKFLFDSTFLWSLARFSVFVLGMFVAAGAKNYSITFSSICFLAAVTIRWMYNKNPAFHNQYCDLLLLTILAFSIPRVCQGFSALIIREPKILTGIFSWLGKHSLEIYVVHETLFSYCKKLTNNCYLQAFLAIFFSLLAAWILKHICKWILNLPGTAARCLHQKR